LPRSDGGRRRRRRRRRGSAEAGAGAGGRDMEEHHATDISCRDPARNFY